MRDLKLVPRMYIDVILKIRTANIVYSLGQIRSQFVIPLCLIYYSIVVF